MGEQWKCPKCGRQFKNRNQAHSCKPYKLEDHFKGTHASAKPLYDNLLRKVKKYIGPFSVYSLECCIHLDTDTSFAAVFALKDKIRVRFVSEKPIKNKRIRASAQISKHQYKNEVEIATTGEIDKQLISWLKKAYNQKHEWQ